MKSKKKKRNRPHSNRRASRLVVHSFLDNSAARGLLVGHPTHKKHLAQAIPQAWYVNNYVRMEFYRSLLVNWIHLYAESAHPKHPTFGAAVLYFAEAFSRTPKNVAIAVGHLLEDRAFLVEDASEKEYCRQRLQDLIFMYARQFDDLYRDNSNDPSHCARLPVPLRLPEPEDRDAALLKLQERFMDVTKCRRSCSIDSLFTKSSSKTRMERIQGIKQRPGDPPGLQKIVQGVKDALGNPDGVTCKSCSGVGDAVVAVSLSPVWKLHTLDHAQGRICDELRIQNQIHLSGRAAVNQGDGGLVTGGAQTKADDPD